MKLHTCERCKKDVPEDTLRLVTFTHTQKFNGVWWPSYNSDGGPGWACDSCCRLAEEYGDRVDRWCSRCWFVMERPHREPCDGPPPRREPVTVPISRWDQNPGEVMELSRRLGSVTVVGEDGKGKFTLAFPSADDLCCDDDDQDDEILGVATKQMERKR